MKKWLAVILLCSKLYAGDDLVLLENLIGATEKHLQEQKELREQAHEYLALRADYLKNDQDKELLFKVAKKAYRVLDLIKENHLEQTFETSFLSELTLFAKFANKGGIPKP
jgi:hypothetical protein